MFSDLYDINNIKILTHALKVVLNLFEFCITSNVISTHKIIKIQKDILMDIP
jgi:hypothetical protein